MYLWWAINRARCSGVCLGENTLDSIGDVANVFETYPDWTIKILSPDQSQTKVIGNILHCLKHGSRLGWLIDPEERSVLVYPLRQQPELLIEADMLTAPDLVAELRLTVRDLFGWLRLGGDR